MEAIAIVTVLALLQFSWFALQVGGARVKYEVKAPSTSGPPEFERAMRVQQNTLEQLVVFVPSLWMYGYYVNPLWGAGIGLAYIIGRFVYRAAYLKDPAGRGPGFTIGYIAMMLLLVWSLVAAVMNLL